MDDHYATITIQAASAAALADAITLLQFGSGDLLVGLIPASPPDDYGLHAFIGQLELGKLQNPAPFLLALIRSIVLGPEKDRNVAMIAGRIWLSSHCSVCGRQVDQTQVDPNIVCTTCEIIESQPGGLARLSRLEQITLDKKTVLSFISDPNTDDGQRDRFYLLIMAEELVRCARDGYLKHGRGAIVLDQSGARPFGVFYIDHTTASAKNVGWPSSQVARWVQEYDALAEMVVCFIKPGGRPVVYRVPIDSVNWYDATDKDDLPPPPLARTA